ncbi:hypothetical protein ACFO0N_08470 [Halobium salinum]|uniref:Uncharacterized protein n=1 Tax=Halobium salinum TaxID=1364940 RepID=A0ABD5PBZ5_9EURY|nr:hypothetical protein [Halobium salinum]
MADGNEDGPSIIDSTACSSCGKEITLIHIRGKYMTIKSTAIPAALGSIGYSLGGSAGVAFWGTAYTASWPLATVGVLAGSSAVYVAGKTKDSLQCPACESDLEI